MPYPLHNQNRVSYYRYNKKFVIKQEKKVKKKINSSLVFVAKMLSGVFPSTGKLKDSMNR